MKEKFEKETPKAELEKFNQRVRNLERVLISKMNKGGKAVKGKGLSRSRSREKRGRGGKGGKAKSKEYDDDYRMSSDSEE